ncbi:MAG TPA: CPBP family intramembrane glutamic endopeptidase [Ktedonobacteraceae bacterium]|nr:CPBP family intramembrane glutamic endopeptidase [Ktedonobacteraceae bacterium]
MQQLGLDAFQVGFVLVGAWLGSQTKSSRACRFAFLALLGLGSIYLGWAGLNMVSPEVARLSPINASGRQALAIAYCLTAIASGLLLMPSTRRIVMRTFGWDLQAPERILGTWLFIIMLFVNVTLLLIASSYTIMLVANGAGHNNPLVNEVARELSYLIIAIVGAGLYFRRSLPAVIERLGLDELCFEWERTLAVAGIVGGGVLLSVLGASILKHYDIAAYNSLRFTINSSLPYNDGNMAQIVILALAVGLVAGIGQEILFRGLLQPTFGLLPTTLLYTALHSQYGLSPAIALVFVSGLAFGWLRQRYSTWAAIIAHIACTTLCIVLWWTIV